MSDGRLLALVAAISAAAVVAASVLGWIGGRASTARERRRLQMLAHRDILTGLLNRAGFAEVAGAVGAAGRGRPAAMLVDLDGFKRINDTYGHAVGDAVLVEVARALEQCVRTWGGIVARLGGDEFVVLLPVCGQPEEVAGAALAVVRDLTRTCVVPVGSQWRRVPVSATVGVGVAGPGAEVDRDQLLRAADAAMYAARRGHASWSVRGAGAGPDPTGPGTAVPRATGGPGRPRAMGDGWTCAGPPRRLGAMTGPRSVPQGPPRGLVGHQAAGVPLARS